MSELPTIDPLKVAQRLAEKYRQDYEESRAREGHLEILAEALRDERDAAKAEVEELKSKISSLEPEVPNITTLPEAV